LVVVKQIQRADLVQRCSTSLDTYARHEEAQYFRCLIAGFSIENAMQAPTTHASQPSANDAKRFELLEVNQFRQMQRISR
jgi:hypothetical protein